jgi:hypothetical protein
MGDGRHRARSRHTDIVEDIMTMTYALRWLLVADQCLQRHGGPRRGQRMTMEEILQLPSLLASPRMLAEALGESGQQSPELDRKFSEYQVEHRKRLAKPFFDQHKNERWFIEKYEPVQLEQRWTEQLAEYAMFVV